MGAGNSGNTQVPIHLSNSEEEFRPNLLRQAMELVQVFHEETLEFLGYASFFFKLGSDGVAENT